MYMSG